MYTLVFPKHQANMPHQNFLNKINFVTTPPKKGTLLISEPMLNDPNFSRSVVLLTEHNHEGSVGFILNQISTVNVDNILPNFSVKGMPIYIGGPVGNDQLFFIHTLGNKISGAIKIIDNLYMGGDIDQLETVLNSEDIGQNQVRFFVGYSGWDFEQLSHEIKNNSWVVANTTSNQIMSDSDQYWKEVMAGLGKDFEVLSKFPSNPGLN